MRKCKRIVTAMLADYMVMGMRAIPALAEPLGNPVTVEEYEGSTYVHLDSHPAYDDTWCNLEGRDKDKFTAIGGGGIE